MSCRFRRATVLLRIAAALVAGHASVVSAQDVVLAGRGPRFLVTSPKRSTPMPLDLRTAPVLRQEIGLRLNGATLAEALTAITRATGLAFVYGVDLLPTAARVSIRAEQITVAAALTQVLVDTDLDVLLLASGRQVALVRRGSAWSPVPGGAIVGRVTDAGTGAAVTAAELILTGTRWRTTTDSGGRYRLAEVEAGNYTLVVRRFGYAKRSQPVTVVAEREDTVNVVLEPVAARLDELVTTATGRQRRRDLGNAITTIHADSVLKSAPIRNLTDLLENRVPGLTVQHTSGAPGDPARLRLRGLGSVTRSNDPIVVVDGVRIYAAQSGQRSGNLTNFDTSAFHDVASAWAPSSVPVPAPSPLDQIDPNIIEKIEIFKGPSAATLYGADAANGVIVITTKRGHPGPTRWTANVTQGITNTPGQYPMGYYRWGHDQFLNLPQFCTLVNRLCIQDSLVLFQALNDPTLTVLGQGHRTGLSLTASGGSKTLTYSVTGSYSNEIGLLTLPSFEADRFQATFNRAASDWMQRPHQLKEWSVTSNVTALLSPSADVTLSTTLSRSDQQRSSLENQVGPLAGTYVDKINNIYYTPSRNQINAIPGLGTSEYAVTATQDFLQSYYVRTTASTITFTTGLNANWHPRSWFTATGQAGLNVIPRDDQSFLPSGLVALTDSGRFAQGTGRSLVSTVNLQGTLRKPLGRGFTFETNIGSNITTTNTSDLQSFAVGLIPGTSSIGGARSITASDSRSATSVFGWYLEPRLSGQRISFSTGIRIDGGSAYGARITGTGPGNPFSVRNLFGLRSLLTLPKLNGSWVVSEEPWFPLKRVFSSLRLRGAYGQAQVQPGATDRLRLYTGSTDQLGGLLTLTTVGNDELRPERSREFEGGFDADLLDSRVSVELTGYRKTQVDALMPVSLPLSVNGGGIVIKNIGTIQNTGLELTLGITPIRQPALTWNTQLNFARNRNVLVELGRGVDANPRQGLVAGYPIGSRWARPILGFADQNGDGLLERNEIQIGDSLVFLGRLLPDYTTSLHTNVALFGGAIGITADFSYEAGVSQVDQTARTNWVLARALVDPSAPLSEQAAVLANDSTDYGLTQTVSTFRFSSFSVNYRMPTPVARLLRAQQLSVAIQGGNLALHSTYHGKDPDVNAWGPGESVMDTGQLPLPRTWQLRFDVAY
jgi:TonB-linked SusC/RagA family outer membrane protein